MESFDPFGSQKYYYDIFGNRIAETDGLGRTTRYTYDKSNRLTRQDFAGGNYDIYEYDALGNRIAHTNGLGDRETYLFDAESRITRHRSFAGRQTSYSYEYRSDIGERGGYRTVTTDVMNNTEIEDIDVFGKLRYRKDLGNHTYSYQYNNAGWLIHQGSSAGQDIDYEYYANGYVKAVNDEGIDSYALFQYDVDGNRILESYSQASLLEAVEGLIPYQVARASYDSQSRLISVEETGKFKVEYEYDQVGNRRRVHSVYTDLLSSTQLDQDFWYKYDSLNRFTTTMGTLQGGQIVRGSTGYDILYDAAGQRWTQTTTGENDLAIRERYEYDTNGFLTSVYIRPHDGAAEAERARRVNDMVGQRQEYIEFNALGIITSRHEFDYDADHNVLEDRDVINATRVEYTLRNDGLLASTLNTDNDSNTADVLTAYSYENWDSYQQATIIVSGIAVNVVGWKNGTSTFTYDVNGHLQSVLDHHEDRRLSYISNHHGQTLKRYEYDADAPDKPHVIRQFYYFNGKPIGDQGTDHVPSRIDYAQSLRESELEGAGNKRYIEQQRSAALPELWRQIIAGQADWSDLSGLYGPVSNQQHQDIGQRVIPVSSADFDQNFQPINEQYPGPAPTTYVVRQGDTLQTIAAAVWGDSSLWYLLADANGLQGSEELVTNLRLTVPNLVTNVHNNAQTYRPVEPGLAMGDTQPTLPEPPPPPKPKKKKSCGGVGQILVAIVAVVVTVYTAGAASAAFASLGATTGAATGVAATTGLGATLSLGATALAGGVGLAGFAGAVVGGAIGSIISQGVGMAMGLQDGFSWSGVALSAIGAGVGAGIGRASSLGQAIQGFAGNAYVGAALSSAAGNVLTQGIATATGLQKRFNWRGVAAATVGGGMGHGARQLLAGADFGAMTDLVTGTLGGLVDGGAQAAMLGHSPNWGAIAASSFGNAAGGSLARSLGGQKTGLVAEQEERQAAKREQQDSRAGLASSRSVAANDATLDRRADPANNGASGRVVAKTLTDPIDQPPMVRQLEEIVVTAPRWTASDNLDVFTERVGQRLGAAWDDVVNTVDFAGDLIGLGDEQGDTARAWRNLADGAADMAQFGLSAGINLTPATRWAGGMLAPELTALAPSVLEETASGVWERYTDAYSQDGFAAALGEAVGDLGVLGIEALATKGLGRVSSLGRYLEVTNKTMLFSSSELSGVERASQTLLDAVGSKRAVTMATEGSDALRYLNYRNAEAASLGPEDIILRANPSKAAVLEEFLHGTQQRLGIVDRLGTSGLGSAETHVKDFMIRHQDMLGLGAEDIRRLQILRDMGL